MDTVDNLPEICTPEEVAKFLRLAIPEIKKLCRKGELAHFRPTPNKIRIPRERIKEYQESCLKRTMESISTTEKTVNAGKSENSLTENVNATQRALAAVRLQRRD